jgi:hypothetical protein
LRSSYKHAIFCSAAAGSVSDEYPSPRLSSLPPIDFTEQLSALLEDALITGKYYNLAGVQQVFSDMYMQNGTPSLPELMEHYIETNDGVKMFRPTLRLEPLGINKGNITITSHTSKGKGPRSPALPCHIPAPSITTSVNVCIRLDRPITEQDSWHDTADPELADVLRDHVRISKRDANPALLNISMSVAMWSMMPRGHAAIGFFGYDVDGELVGICQGY